MKVVGENERRGEFEEETRTEWKGEERKQGIISESGDDDSDENEKGETKEKQNTKEPKKHEGAEENVHKQRNCLRGTEKQDSSFLCGWKNEKRKVG